LDGSNVLGDATGSDPWTYEVPDSEDSQTVAWTVEASNVEGSETASGSEAVAANLFAPTITSAPQITGTPAQGATVGIVSATASGTQPITITDTLALGSGDVTSDISGGQYTIPPTATVGQTLTLTSVASNGVSPDAQDSVSVTVTVFTPADLFTGSEEGLLLEAFDIGTLFQLSGGTTPVTVATDPIGYFGDKSGRANHATQATAAARPIYQTAPDRVTIDGVDDRMTVTVPVGGFTGTMVLATDQGTASYGVNIPAGPYEIGGRGGQYFPGNSIVGQLIRDGALSAGDAAATEAYFVENGATASYGAVTSFSQYWREWSELTSFPLIDTSSGTSFTIAWYRCSSLTSFPLIDTSAGTDFFAAWYNCTSLTSFPANAFDNIKGGNFTDAFTNTALTQTSIDNILVSLVTSGIATETRVFDQSGGSAPSAGTGQPAIDTLRSRGWTVTVTGGY